jgi:hypothetical protein
VSLDGQESGRKSFELHRDLSSRSLSGQSRCAKSER